MMSPSFTVFSESMCNFFYSGSLNRRSGQVCPLIGMAAESLGDKLSTFVPLLTCKTQFHFCTLKEASDMSDDQAFYNEELECEPCTSALRIFFKMAIEELSTNKGLVCTLFLTIFQNDTPCQLLYMENGSNVISTFLKNVMEDVYLSLCIKCLPQAGQADDNSLPPQHEILGKTLNAISSILIEDIETQLEAEAEHEETCG